MISYNVTIWKSLTRVGLKNAFGESSSVQMVDKQVVAGSLYLSMYTYC